MDEFDITPLAPDADDEAESAQSDSAADPAPRQRVASPFASRLNSRGRFLRVGRIALLVLLTMMGLLLATPSGRSALASVVSQPTATPAAGSQVIAVEDQVPWGALFIDGRAQPTLGAAVPASSSAPARIPTFTLRPGYHIVEYRAEPFTTLYCSISVPANASDTCPLDLQPFQSSSVAVGAPSRLLDLSVTVNQLSPTDALALAAATQQVLTTSASLALDGILAPGDHYVGGAGAIAVAREPLAAKPTYTLGQDPPSGAGVVCEFLCSVINPLAQVSADEWRLLAPVDLRWQYRTAQGKLILANGPPGPTGAQQSAIVEVGVQRSSGQWVVHIVPNGSATDPVLCAVAGHTLDAVRSFAHRSAANPFYHWPTLEWSSLDPGCLIVGSNTVDANGAPTGTLALVLYRFGALLAVNDEAHRVLPQLPLANTHEQALAHSLGAQPAASASTSGD